MTATDGTAARRPLGTGSPAGGPGSGTGMEGVPGGRPRVPALGGDRRVPAPDPVARDYLLLALRLGQWVEGLVDTYVGPADLKAQADLEPRRPPETLAVQAAALRDRLEGLDPSRRRWLAAQLRALETLALLQAGATFPYLELVERLFDRRPRWRDEEALRAVHQELAALLPGSGGLQERLARWDEDLTIPVGRLDTVAELTTAQLRRMTDARLGLPPGEAVSLSAVTGRPWGAYAWYEGGRRSSIQLNVDVPVRLPELVATLAHETYPGHHTEHSWKETLVVEQAGWLEASIRLIDTPECLVSEGLAEVALEVLLAPEDETELYARLLPESGVRLAASAAGAGGGRDQLAARITAIARIRRRLRPISVNAALLRHVDGRPPEAVAAYLREVGLMDPDRAAKRLAFIDHPLWRPYAVVYGEGAMLVDRWLGGGREGRLPRFRRLLGELCTPGELAAEAAGEVQRDPAER